MSKQVAGQPSIDQAYETAGNPTDKEPIEKARAHINAKTDEENAITHRSPEPHHSFSTATPTSMARGIRGAGPGEETRGLTQSELDSQELEPAQMGAPGEGKIASAVDTAHHAGSGGREPGLETDLDRKKAEQAPLRKELKEQKEKEFDVGGVLGQRGGVANPVDKNNYPNSGSA